jgi:hypothetical protein
MLMNGTFVQAQADSFAARLEQDCGDDDGARIRRAWELAFSREPSQEELADAQKFLTDQQAELKTRAGKKDNPRHQALASLCQVLLGSNEFLYVD